MKTFVPRKFKVGVHLLIVALPLAVALVLFLVGVRSVFALSWFIAGAIGGRIYYMQAAPKQASLIFDLEKNTVTNNMMDGTPEQPNFGWTESLDNIKKVHLVAKETAKKYDPNTYAKKAILLNLGEKGYKTIRVESFNDDELCDILDLLQQKKPVDSEKQE